MKLTNSRSMRARRAVSSRRSTRAVMAALRTARLHSRFSRRRFLHRSANASLLLSLSSQISKPEPEDSEERVIFFNLSSSQAPAGEDKTPTTRYFFNVGGRSYRLQRVSTNPRVLRRARRRNAFLSAVPDDQITHYIEGFTAPAHITLLGYIGSVIDEASGTWSMASVVQYLDSSGIPEAYAHARTITPSGPLPLSAKREFYSIPAAFSEQDVADEFALLDYTDTARTLIGLHPDLLCADPMGAKTIAVSGSGANVIAS